MVDEHPLDERLVAYLVGRTEARNNAVSDLLGRLSEREKRLIREAAVMGYVRGQMSVPGRSVLNPPPVPPDSAIVVEVVDAMLSMPDLYPFVAWLSQQEVGNV